MQKTHLSHLMRVLDDYGILYDHESVESAVTHSSRRTAVEAWIRNELDSTTLVTRDELLVFSTITGKRDCEATQISTDLTPTQDLSCQEVQDAIEALRKSTAAVEKQSDVLRSKQRAMVEMTSHSNLTADGRLQGSQQRGSDKERANIVAGNLTESLHYRAADLEEQRHALHYKTKQDTSNFLNSHDILFLSLQKLLGKFSSARGLDDRAVLQIQEICARLVKYSILGIRTKLDRIYLNAAMEPWIATNISHGTGVEVDDIVDMEQELETLYTEIVPVVQMSVERQFLGPARQMAALKHGQDDKHLAVAIRYAQTCLDIVLKKTRLLLNCIERKQCLDMASHSIIKTARTEILNLEKKPAVSSPRAKIPNRRRSSSSGIPAQLTKPLRRNSGLLDDSSEPELQIMQSLGISLVAGAVRDQIQVEVLKGTLSDRQSKYESHMANLQSAIESLTSSYLRDAYKTAYLLEDYLVPSQEFTGAKYADKGHGQTLDNFLQYFIDLRVHLEVLQLQQPQTDVFREEFFKRWIS